MDFTIEEMKALDEFLKDQWITQDCPELHSAVNKIAALVTEYELAEHTRKSTQ